MWKKTLLVLVVTLACGLLIAGTPRAENKGFDDVLKLLDAKVAEQNIIEYIEARKLEFSLSADDILKLKAKGATTRLLSVMLKRGSDPAQPAEKNGDFPFMLDKDLKVHKGIRHKNLVIFPVTKVRAVKGADYLSLDEATKQKIITIAEQGRGGNVPQVIITNPGNRPIYIMAGEIIIGGKQNRMVSHDVIIMPGTTVTVSVRCVEQSRWRAGGKGAAFTSAGNAGTFGTRAGVQFKSQGEVWKEVKKELTARGKKSPTANLNTMYSGKDMEAVLKAYQPVFTKALAGEHIVGVIVAVDGKIKCADIFYTPKLFQKLKDKLLKSYIFDAAASPQKLDTVPGKADITSFFEKAKKAKRSNLKKYSHNKNDKLEGDGIIGNEAKDEKGKKIHINLYRQ